MTAGLSEMVSMLLYILYSMGIDFVIIVKADCSVQSYVLVNFI